MATRWLTQRQAHERIIQTLAEIGPKLGLIEPKEARKQARKMFKMSLNWKPKDAFPPLLSYSFFEIFGKRLNARRWKEDELKDTLAKLRSAMQGLPTLARKGMEEMRRRLPRRGGPGRSEILNQSQKIEACEQIAVMVKTKKIPFPDIFKSVAANFTIKGTKTSPQTIKRAWQKRESLYT